MATSAAPDGPSALALRVAGGAGARTPGQGVVLAARLVLGLAEIARDALAESVGRAAGGGPPAVPELVGAAAAAAVGLGLEAQRRALAAAGRASAALAPAGSFVLTRLEPWRLRGLDEQRRNRELADRFLRAIVARLAMAVLDELDVDAVADRVDVERILARVDFDAVAERIDLDRIVGRLEMGEIIRESTSSLADESVDALRLQGMNADRLVGGIVDRLLRRGERRTRLDGA